MFCPNCGAQNPDESKFCGACGASLTAETQAEPQLQQDENLPEGIFLGEDGAYHWVYFLDMLRNPVPLYTVLKIFFCIITGMSVFMFFFMLGDGLTNALKTAAIMFVGINALFFVLSLMAWGIMAMTRKARYVIEYMMDEEMVAYLQTAEEQNRTKQMAAVNILAGVVTGNLSSLGFGLTQATRGDAWISRYGDVKSVSAKRKMDLIKVNNTLRRNQIYAYTHQYDFVWNYITSHCPDAKIQD